mmetsp:Transcript_62/g.284  ORF Transcript_62/g.284 Transcript_62/m.284 type:complete len:376 (-) Transcript_62:152-1279(-)
MRYFLCLWILTTIYESHGFLSLLPSTAPNRHDLGEASVLATTTPSTSTTALNVWWFGGSPSEQSVSSDDESCELVAVRIERPTSNSRRIFGDIAVAASVEDVWAILTDYDRLAIHVPNLVESRVVQKQSPGEQGDGSYRCRLFQRGAQKIVGFEFGASVTMDMKEFAQDLTFELPPAATGANHNIGGQRNRERRIEFKCTDSMFFSTFDGEWKVTEQTSVTGEPESLLSYVVDVKPNGPVPVAALEWRIREDVPTNLRAVKKAAVEVGMAGVQSARTPRRLPPPTNGVSRTAAANGQQANSAGAKPRQAETSLMASSVGTPPALNGKAAPKNGKSPSKQQRQRPKRKLGKVMVQWDSWEENETMARYLNLDDNQS